jgi:hypothetical protein
MVMRSPSKKKYFMNDVNKNLNQIEDLLSEAEDALTNNDGRCWPPPPVPPKRRRDWAKENGSAVDPSDDDSCKQYLLHHLPVRPVLRVGTFERHDLNRFVSEMVDKPNQWIALYPNSARTHESVLQAVDLFGIAIELEQSDGWFWGRYSGATVSRIDSRPMTYAQRLAEGRLLECRSLIRITSESIEKMARGPRSNGNSCSEDHIASRYYREVICPIRSLFQARNRFNKLSNSLHRCPKRRLLPKGCRLYLSNFYHIPYFFGESYTTNIDCRTLLAITSGLVPERSCQPQDWLRAEASRWKRLLSRWSATGERAYPVT